MAATIHSIGTAFPPFSFSAEEAEERLSVIFAGLGERPELVRQIVQNSGIERRFLARPPSWYLEHESLKQRNDAYSEVARELGLEAARAALEAAKVKPSEVDVLIDTSCTGVMIPALDAYLSNALGMRKDVRRIPLTEAGCAAGATSLALATDLLKTRPGGTALLVSLELPSLTLQLDDPRRANVISAAIFGDGCAALVLADRPAAGPSVEVLAHTCTLFPNTESIMGFDLGDRGFEIILSKRIPLLIRKHLRAEVDDFLERQGLSLAALDFFALHPGGTKVISSLREVLDLEDAQVQASRDVLREYGNLSSASVHMVTKRLLDQGAIRPGALGLLAAMGPGFCVELSLLRGVA